MIQTTDGTKQCELDYKGAKANTIETAAGATNAPLVCYPKGIAV